MKVRTLGLLLSYSCNPWISRTLRKKKWGRGVIRQHMRISPFLSFPKSLMFPCCQCNRCPGVRYFGTRRPCGQRSQEWTENRRILAELSVEKMTRRVGVHVPARIPSNEIAGSASLVIGTSSRIISVRRRDGGILHHDEADGSEIPLILYGDRNGRRVDESNGNW
jgi:hypothetical protein